MDGDTHLLLLKDRMCSPGGEVQMDSLGMMNLLIGNFDLFIWALSIRLLFSVSIKKICLCNLKTDDGCTNILKRRNVPKIIESLSVDGSTGQQIESSKVDPSTGAVIPSLSCHVLT